MAHTALGAVATALTNTTQDKVLTLTTPLAVGTLLLAYGMGYGVDGTIDLVDVTDSDANTWDWTKRSAASSSRFAMLAWSRLANPMLAGDTVTINMTGSYSRGTAGLRAYTGLGAAELEKKTADGFSNPQTTGALVATGLGRAVAAVFYPSEVFTTNKWINSFGQTVNVTDGGNFDTYTVGERTFSGGSTVTPAVDLGLSASFIAVAVTLPEEAMPGDSAGRRRSPVVL